MRQLGQLFRFFETSFLSGRAFASPSDFNDQIADWLTTRANTRTVRAIHGRPVDLLETDRQAMTVLPPLAPTVGLTHRIRLARDYYVRVDTCDYSVDPRAIGRFVDITASPATVEVFCDRELVARHERSWAKHLVITDPDPDHVATARQMRHALADPQVQQCYYVTGSYDFILIVTARDMQHFEAFTRRALFAPNIRRFTTNVVMGRVKTGLTVPVALQ